MSNTDNFRAQPMYDHHPFLGTELDGSDGGEYSPTYWARVEHFTGESIETHIHMTMDELLELVREQMDHLCRVITVGVD